MPLVYAKQIYTKNRELPYFVWGIREMFLATIYLALLGPKRLRDTWLYSAFSACLASAFSLA